VAEVFAHPDLIDAVLAARFTSALDDRVACIAAFERHTAAVRGALAPSWLVEWRAADGWTPLCAALGVPVPDEPFPRVKTREDFLAGHRPTGA
jgi:hypothetical protein